MIDKQLVRKTLIDRLSDSDIRTICYDLEIDRENLKGENKTEVILGLLTELQRKGRSEDLFNWIERDRPDIHKDLFPASPTPTDTDTDIVGLSDNQAYRDKGENAGIAVFCVIFFCASWGILTFIETGLIQNLELNWLPLSPFAKGLASSIIGARITVKLFSY